MVARINNALHPKQAKSLFPVAKAGRFMPPILPRTTKMDAKTKNQRQDPASRKTEIGIIDGKVY